MATRSAEAAHSAPLAQESREDKAQNPFASNGRYNLFRPLTALLDLPKIPVFTAAKASSRVRARKDASGSTVTDWPARTERVRRPLPCGTTSTSPSVTSTRVPADWYATLNFVPCT